MKWLAAILLAAWIATLVVAIALAVVLAGFPVEFARGMR